MPDARGGVDALGQARLEPHGDDEVAGAVRRHGAGPRDGDVEEADLAAVLYRRHVDDLAGVGDERSHPRGGPLQVVVELHPQREEGLVVHEVRQPSLLVQVADEAAVARGIARRHEILQERDLHRRVLEQHAAVPAERLLALEEHGLDHVVGARLTIVLVDREREREIGRPEADADHVVHATMAGRVLAHEGRSRSIAVTRLSGRMSVQCSST